MMDTSRIIHLFVQHLPEFLKKKLSPKENHFFASMTNIPHSNEENFIYDTDGYLLLMETTQSNLSLFNISCDSLIFNENEHFNIKSRQYLNTPIKHSNSSTNIHFDIKKFNYRSTMIFSEEIFSAKTNNLQRWQGVELLNTYA